MTICKTRIFTVYNAVRGTVLIEFLLTIALAGTLLPFIYNYQQRAVTRAENLKITRQMQKIQTVLERYITENRDRLLTTLGRNIVRVKISDLADYGLDADVIEDGAGKYQLRILKSSDVSGGAGLQGVIVFNDAEINPMRTREIVSMGDDKIGFIDGTRAYGGFGTWRANTSDLGISEKSGIIQTTSINRENALYLWRVPSNDMADATMLSPLNFGERDILDAGFVNAAGMIVDETFGAANLAVGDLIFKNRTTIDSTFKTPSATVAGTLSGDSKSISVSGTLSINDIAKASGFTAENLWVNHLTLSGLSTPSGVASTLRATQSLDMTEGRVSAMFVTVGFTGSMTSRINVKEKVQDSINPAYFWDVRERVANMVDINSPILSDMAPRALRHESVSGTVATRIFGGVVSNKNATVGDFMNAINEIQNNVRGKYHMLKLE